MKRNNIKLNSRLKTETLFDTTFLRCFTFLLVCMLASPSTAEIWNKGTAATDTFSNLAYTEMQIKNNLLKHQLQQARISNYQIEKTGKSKNELEQLIQQLHSIVITLPEQPPKSIITDKTASQTEPNETTKDTDNDVKPTKASIQPENQKRMKPDYEYEPIREDTLKMIESLMKEPERIQNPFELAELLYLSGHPEKAAKLYQQALNLSDPNAPEATRDKAWILFQIGNCLRDNDLQAAKNIYRKLIAEYPDHPWAGFAKVQEKIIDWYLKDKPHELIKECRKLAEE